MKLCTKCLRELFDRDEKCDICGNTLLLSSDDINKIRDDIICANVFKRKKLLDIEPYKSVHPYLVQTMGDGYWSKSVYTSDKVAYPSENTNTITVECPYCHSKDTTKISTTSKVINTAIWGPFGSKRFKEWHCNSCNSDF